MTQFSVSRASDDLSDNTGYNETRIYYGVGGVRGDFETMGRTVNFESYASYGLVRSLDFGEGLNSQRFINATNVTTNAAGQIVCTTAQTRPGGFAAPGGTPIADPNCVPLNILGEGRASDAARAYVIQDTVVTSEQEQFVFNANLATTLFKLFGNDIGISAGYEHREEKALFQPDAFTVAGLGRSVPIGGLQGKYNLDEAFGEVVVPLFTPDNNFFLSSATLFGRGRYTDNSIVGSNFAYTVGGTFAPIRDIEFRGNYTQSFRSPAITELFLPVVNAFSTVPDLCQANSRNLGPAPAVRAANCAAFIAAFPGTNFNVPDPASTATVASQSGGNIDLGNEKATSYTFGAIIRPRFIPRLAITADYINIRLDGPIANLTAAQVASGCFDNENFDTSDVLNANAFCSRITRNPATGRVSNDPLVPGIRTGFVNGNVIKFSGIQGTIGYSLPLSGIGLPGELSASGDMLYVRRRVNDITGVAPVRIDGQLSDPEFAGQLRIRYVDKKFGINTTFNYTGEQLFSRLNREQGQPSQGTDAREIDQLDDFVIVNAGLFIDPTEDFRLTFSVNNVFNRQGQKYFGELIPASFLNSGGDQIGRRFSASARVRF